MGHDSCSKPKFSMINDLKDQKLINIDNILYDNIDKNCAFI